jgi:hypothetical protein
MIHIDLIGPWIIPQRPSKSPKLSAKPDVKQPLQVLALTMIDPSTNLLELIVVSDKESCTVARAFDRSWLCRYPRPLICLHDKGTKFTGIEFQEATPSILWNQSSNCDHSQPSNQCNPQTHPPSNHESTLIPPLDVH